MTTSITLKNKLYTPVKKLIILAFWLAVWECIALAVGRDVLLPAPHSVLLHLYSLIQTALFWQSAGFTLFRIFIGFLTATLSAALVAVLTYRFKLLREFISPIIGVMKATPVASFIILALVWLSRTNVPGFASFIMVFPVIWSNTDAGLYSADKNLLEVTKQFKFSRAKSLRLFFFPYISPYFSAACRTSLGLAWKAGIAAEVLCTPKFSIGKQLYESKIYLESGDLFAWTLTVILLSLLLEFSFDKVFTHFAQRRTRT